ncbi:MAG: methyltransferase domain-containing protein [Methylocella sp.]
MGLDVGSGTGNYAFPFLKNFEQVIGLEIDKEMLSVAQRKPDAQKVRWIEGNAMAINLETASCDAIWCISTLHYFRAERQRKLFAEIFRLLRPGAVIAVDTEFTEQHSSLRIVEYFPSLKARYQAQIFSKQVYKEWLEEIGFSDVRFGCFELEQNCQDKTLCACQHKPELYLDEEFLKGLPSFHEMDPQERTTWKLTLRQDIYSGKVHQIMNTYSKQATEIGSVELILARK